MKRAVELLRLVARPASEGRRLPAPVFRASGMRQRAIGHGDGPGDPALIVRSTLVLRVIRRMQEVFGTVILITHHLGVVADVRQRCPGDVRGMVLERADRRTLFFRRRRRCPRGSCSPCPPTARGSCARSQASRRACSPRPGCPFAPRCVYVMQQRDVLARPVGSGTWGHLSACWLPHDEADGGASSAGWRTSTGKVGRTDGSVRTRATGPVSETDPAPAAAADGDDVAREGEFP